MDPELEKDNSPRRGELSPKPKKTTEKKKADRKLLNCRDWRCNAILLVHTVIYYIYIFFATRFGLCPPPLGAMQ